MFYGSGEPALVEAEIHFEKVGGEAAERWRTHFLRAARNAGSIVIEPCQDPELAESDDLTVRRRHVLGCPSCTAERCAVMAWRIKRVLVTMGQVDLLNTMLRVAERGSVRLKGPKRHNNTLRRQLVGASA